MFAILVNYCCCDEVGSAERVILKSKLASFVRLLDSKCVFNKILKLVEINFYVWYVFQRNFSW